MRQHNGELLGQPVDVSQDFYHLQNAFYIAGRLVELDPQAATGRIEWRRHALVPRADFDRGRTPFVEDPVGEFPPDYELHPVLPFALSFITPRTVRLRLASRPGPLRDEPSLMLAGDLPAGTPGGAPAGAPWGIEDGDGAVTYRSPCGSVTVTRDPWHVEFRDAGGRLLTRSQNLADTKCLLNSDPTPCSFVRRAPDWAHRMAASFSLSPDEKLFGTGESFTRLNKRGQRIILHTVDALGAQTMDMYKPIPFFLSSRGYGMFVHTSTPITLDMGCSYDEANVIYLGDDALDLFVFLGSPKEILAEYTALTGRSPTPPLWSFGLWMSRITYSSEDEVRQVAADLRRHRVPCDVIHIDTGWFEQDWRCDYRFSTSRFRDPARMIADLREQGLRISLWQLPYFTPKNALYREAVEAGYVVRDADGNLATEDAIVDFSNPKAVRWYQGLLARLLEMGVAAIKVDFGEAAPLNGLYASGRSGLYEHNLYPLRYNKAAAEVTHDVTGEWIIWARSTWAGSQRYPLHWGGDAENTDSAMAATLRAGLSLGLCGFSFWSHDIGGFVQRSPRELYRRWLPFGMLTSHSRCHGAPPKEPWAYDEAFTADFRRAVELKYRLMPYVYAQARLCSQLGLPMLRALFVEYPGDPTSWLVEDEYLFGRDLLVAPLFEEVTERDVYLPPGAWIDYQTGRAYEGARWHRMAAGEIPVVLLAREGAVIPHIAVAQSTSEMDWGQLDLVVYGEETGEAEGHVCLPEDGVVYPLRLRCEQGAFALVEDPLAGRVRWRIVRR